MLQDDLILLSCGHDFVQTSRLPAKLPVKELVDGLFHRSTDVLCLAIGHHDHYRTSSPHVGFRQQAAIPQMKPSKIHGDSNWKLKLDKTRDRPMVKTIQTRMTNLNLCPVLSKKYAKTVINSLRSSFAILCCSRHNQCQTACKHETGIT